MATSRSSSRSEPRKRSKSQGRLETDRDDQNSVRSEGKPRRLDALLRIIKDATSSGSARVDTVDVSTKESDQNRQPSCDAQARQNQENKPDSGRRLKPKTKTKPQQGEPIRMGKVGDNPDVVESCVRTRGEDKRLSKEGKCTSCQRLKNEKDELSQECSNLRLKLSEKEELLQALIEKQQLKKETVTVVETDTDVSNHVTHSQEVLRLQSKVESLQVDVEKYTYAITEHAKEIKMLRERCESRGLRIKSLDEQNRQLSEKATKFELCYHTESEENQSLRQTIETFEQQLNHKPTLDDGDEIDDCNGDKAVTHKTVVALKIQIKQLNEDITKMREHSKQQSQQIREYRQQAEMTKAMEEQLRSMEEFQQTIEDERDTIQRELKDVRIKLNEYQNERKLLCSELKLSKEEGFRFSHEKDKLKAKYDTLRLELNAQLVDANKAIKDLEQQLEVSQLQMKQYRDDFKAERRDRESAHSIIADLEKHSVRDCDENHLKNQLCLAEQRCESLSQELTSARGEMEDCRHECQMLRHQLQSKSSQVKQYAKEVDRLKQALQEVSTHNHSYCGVEQITTSKASQTEEIHTKAQIDLQVLSGTKEKTNRQSIKSWPLAIESKQHRQSSPSKRVDTTERVNSDYVNQSVLLQYMKCHDRIPPRHQQVGDSGDSKSKGNGQSCLQSNVSDSVNLECKYDGGKLTSSATNREPSLSPSHLHEGEQASSSQVGKEVGPDLTLEQDSPCQDNVSNLQVIDNTSTFEDSVALFENPLQKKLDDEIHQEAAEVIHEVSGGTFDASTDRRRPYDPNLVCPMCRRRFRIGEIQKFRRHVNTCTGTDD